MTKIIAEIGHNHNGNMDLACEMIQEAAECGADIAKFQLYDVDKIKKPHQSRYYELKYAQLSYEDLELLSDTCEKFGIEFMSSVFSIELIDWLEDLKVKRYKVASRTANDKLLIQRLIAIGKPIIISHGVYDIIPVNDRNLDFTDVDHLYCVADYPATIDPIAFPNYFSGPYTGFSDHSIGTYWAKQAIDRGAKYVEKHFTLSKQLPGYNQEGSCEPYELKEICKHAKK